MRTYAGDGVCARGSTQSGCQKRGLVLGQNRPIKEVKETYYCSLTNFFVRHTPGHVCRNIYAHTHTHANTHTHTHIHAHCVQEHTCTHTQTHTQTHTHTHSVCRNIYAHTHTHTQTDTDTDTNTDRHTQTCACIEGNVAHTCQRTNVKLTKIISQLKWYRSCKYPHSGVVMKPAHGVCVCLRERECLRECVCCVRDTISSPTLRECLRECVLCVHT